MDGLALAEEFWHEDEIVAIAIEGTVGPPIWIYEQSPTVDKLGFSAIRFPE